LFEGDILGVERGAAQIPTSTRLKWPNGVVPYIIDSIYSKAELLELIKNYPFLKI
jgi:hypothetical protein